MAVQIQRLRLGRGTAQQEGMKPALQTSSFTHYCVSTLIKANNEELQLFKIKCFNPAYHERVSKITVLTLCGPPLKNYCLARQGSQFLKKLNQEINYLSLEPVQGQSGQSCKTPSGKTGLKF